MLKDRFGQNIGPGDIVFDVDARMLCVVSGVDVGQQKAEVYWLHSGYRGGRTVVAPWLIRVSDYSDCYEHVQEDIQALESLYTTITGERYG